MIPFARNPENVLYLRVGFGIKDRKHSTHPLPGDLNMADQPLDPSKSKNDSDKKQPETVLLTAEELRAIAGGGVTSSGPPTGTSPGSPNPTPKGLVGAN